MQILPITLAAAGARAGLEAGAAVIDQAGSFASRLTGAGRNSRNSTARQADGPQTGPSASGEAVTLNGLEQQLKSLLSTAHQQFTSLLEHSGHTVDPPVRLQFDPATGEFAAPDDHPHRTEIDALLAENPELTNQFRRILALQSLLQAARSQTSAQRPSSGTRAAEAAGAGVLSVLLDRHEARVELA